MEATSARLFLWLDDLTPPCVFDQMAHKTVPPGDVDECALLNIKRLKRGLAAIGLVGQRGGILHFTRDWQV